MMHKIMVLSSSGSPRNLARNSLRAIRQQSAVLDGAINTYGDSGAVIISSTLTRAACCVMT